MNIGVLFKHHPFGGGIYQYFLAMMETLSGLDERDRIYLFYCHANESIHKFNASGISLIKLPRNKDVSSDSVGKDPPSHRYKTVHGGKEISFKTKPLTEALKKEATLNEIDLMIYPTPERESFETGIPYIMSIHDVYHKIRPDFNEFSADGVYEQREYVITNGIKNALCILVDSRTSKEQLIHYYGAESFKIMVLPFLPPPYLFEEISPKMIGEVKTLYNLPDQFIFYPAQFWEHKNHESIVKALHFLKEEKGVLISAVFSGSGEHKWSSYEEVRRLADHLKVKSQLCYLGYVDSRQMGPLYRLATALVMPILMDPTNIPIVEAFAMGCPVISSNLKGTREQTGGAALLIDPNNPEEIGETIYRVWTDEDLRNVLAMRGLKKSKEWTAADFHESLMGIVENCRKRLL